MKVKLLKKVRSKYWIEKNKRTRQYEVHHKSGRFYNDINYHLEEHVTTFDNREDAFKKYRTVILEKAHDLMIDKKRTKIIIKHAEL